MVNFILFYFIYFISFINAYCGEVLNFFGNKKNFFD